MEKSLSLNLFTLFAILLLGMFSGPNLMGNDTTMTFQQMEAQGLTPDSPPGVVGKAGSLSNMRSNDVLLIPDSSTDQVHMFDPFDGAYLGVLIDGAGLFSTPINAVQGPDNNIYVSDQVADSVFVYDTTGTYLYTYADGTDGLNNIRGIDFNSTGHLFVTSGDDYVAEFSGPHVRLPDFIADGTDPFDILFLPNGKSLMCDIQSTTDNIRLYDSTGTLEYELFKVSFPEQVQIGAGSNYLEASFSDKHVQEFDISGAIIATLPLSNYGRGCYPLGNGNVLSSGYPGVQELDPVTGALITQIMTGTGWRFAEKVSLDQSLEVDLDEISAATGGVANFALDAGLTNPNENYFILASITGTSPGLPLPPGWVTLPLVWDSFTDLAIGYANSLAMPNFKAVTDANGQSTAQLNTLGPVDPSAIGVTIYFAFLLYDPVNFFPYDFVSNPVDITIIP